MPKFLRKVSYETVKYDTPDGELHKGQYATDGLIYFVRNHPENNFQPDIIDPREDKDWQVKIQGLTKVDILPGEEMYFDEFTLPNGRVYRVKSTREKYYDQTRAGGKIPEVSLTAIQITNISKDDHLWQ